MKNEILQAADSIVTTALNGMAQGLILVLFVGVILRLFGRTNAATRYMVWWITLFLLLLLLPANYYLRGPLPGTGHAWLNLAPERRPDPQLLTSDPADAEPDSSNVAGNLAAAAPQHAPDAELLPAANPNLPAPATAGWNPRAWHLAVISALPTTLSVVLLGAWAALASLRAAFLFAGLHQVRKLKGGSIPVEEGSLHELFQRLRSELRVRRRVQLAVSAQQESPVVAGFLPPVILLPSEEQGTEGILAHELAHVRRYDDWANLHQQVLRALLFFHPGVWWISRHLSLEREIACDDYVLHQGKSPRAYALLLIDSARRWKEPGFLLAPGASANHSQLQQRIDMILNTNRNISPRLGKLRLGFTTSAAALIATLAFAFGPKLVRAQSAATPAVTAAESANATGQVTAAELAQADSSDRSTPADVAPGPKAKSGDADSSSHISVSPDDKAVNVTPRAPRRHRVPEPVDHNSNLEDRLDRLERMVQSLVAQQKRPRPERDFALPDNQNRALNENQSQNFKEMAKRNDELAADQAKRMAKLAQEEVARATDQARRAAKQATDAFRYQDDGRDQRGAWEKSLQAQVKILQKQRDVLQREMEKLQREIERIQQQHERMDEKQQRHSELKENQDKDGEAPAAKP
jgi:beta-lactamase regulating signal transducer with metallopeptidase domain